MTMVQSYKCILGLKLAEDLESVPTTTTSSDPTQLTLHKLHGWLCDDEEEVKYFSFLLSRRFENMRRDIDGIFPRGSFHFLQRQSLSLSIFSTQGIFVDSPPLSSSHVKNITLMDNGYTIQRFCINPGNMPKIGHFVYLSKERVFLCKSVYTIHT